METAPVVLTAIHEQSGVTRRRPSAAEVSLPKVAVTDEALPVYKNLTAADLIVLETLFSEAPNNINTPGRFTQRDVQTSISQLRSKNDPKSTLFSPSIFTSFDTVPAALQPLVSKYSQWAQRVVRHPTDVVFLTHQLFYTCINLTSALYLYTNPTLLHSILHIVLTGWCIGPFTLLMHNHIHNNGVLAAPYTYIDKTLPYILCPLMGHTWNSYYHHHVKHHHIEGNGPEDLSSTLRYQRDSALHFLHYLARFIFLTWAELPYYFLKRNQPRRAASALFWELGSYVAAFALWRMQPAATLAVLVVPFAFLRVGLMAGNWGQHALIDHEDPKSDLRESVTLLDVAVSYLISGGWWSRRASLPLPAKPPQETSPNVFV
ncbi:hypothetical protein K470DRAFT_257584, partial [Piedraia hortae CBS 480.64]